MSKPKILVTGMNKAQCTRDAHENLLQLKVIPSHYSLVKCLEGMGYDVEQRFVELGEDLSSYDEVIVIVHPTGSFSQRLWAGLYTIASRPNCIIVFDDWQFPAIFKDLTAYRKQLSEGNGFRDYLLSMWQGKETSEDIKKYESLYLEACDIILGGKNRLLMSAFAGGDISLLSLDWPKDRIFIYNPNPYHLNRRPDNNYGVGAKALDMFDEDEDIGVPPSKKLYQWNFASLVHGKTRAWLKKKKIEWPINYYGATRGEFKCERLTEPEMCRVFNAQWGCLMPGYKHAGSGWWRSRPLQVANAGSILIGDAKEMKVTHGQDYVQPSVTDIEAMDLSQLIATAKEQKDRLYDFHPLDKKVQEQELRAVLEAAK